MEQDLSTGILKIPFTTTVKLPNGALTGLVQVSLLVNITGVEIDRLGEYLNEPAQQASLVSQMQAYNRALYATVAQPVALDLNDLN